MIKPETIQLKDLCDPERGITYGIVKVGDYAAGGVPVIRGGDIRDNRIVFDDAKRVSSDVSNQFRRTILRGGEIVLNLISEPGHSAVVPAAMAGYNVTRDVAVIPLIDSVNHEFINYFLKSPRATGWLTSRLQGSVTQKINLGILSEMPVTLPRRSKQDSVARLLGSLDDKIVANEQIINLCDQLRAVRLQEIKSQGFVNVDRKALSSLASFVNGRPFTKDASGTGRMVIRIAELNSGPGLSTVYNDISVSPQYLARAGDILFAWSGSLAVVRWYRSEAIVNQHIFKVVPNNSIPAWLIYDILRSELPKFKRIAADKATTMGHIQRHHLDVEVDVPAVDHWNRLDENLGLLWQRALATEQETIVLAELRDMLLPMLLTGELRIRDAEKVVEDAV
jgi:type I restriction enzyme, S subunit